MRAALAPRREDELVKVRIEAEGPQAQAALDEAAAFFEREFNVKAEALTIEAAGSRRGIDPVWIAIILAVPPAIESLVNLAERLELIRRTETMLKQMRDSLGDGAGVIRIGARLSFDIATAKAREIIDAIREAKDEADEDSGK